MPDVAIVNTTVTGTPTDYTVPGTQELILKSVRAAIDGTGAGSAFLPALQLLDPAGHVMWTAVDNSSTGLVAAGGSADVSWFPGLGGGSGGAAVSAWAFGHLTVAQSIPAGTTRPVGFNTAETSDSSVFTWTTNTVPNDTLVLHKPGIVAMQMSQGWDAPQTYNRAGWITTDLFSGDGFSHNATTDAGTDTTALGFNVRIADMQVGITNAVPANTNVEAANGDAVARHVSTCDFAVFYVSNATFAT